MATRPAAARAALTLAPSCCSACARRTYSRAQVRRWPHLARHDVVDLVDGLCPGCLEARARAAAQREAEEQAALEAARAVIAAQRAALEAAEAAEAERVAAQRQADLERARAAAAATAAAAPRKSRRTAADIAADPDRPSREQRRAWSAEDHAGPRGLRRVYGGHVVRWTT